jgi:hypothetical protein
MFKRETFSSLAPRITVPVQRAGKPWSEDNPVLVDFIAFNNSRAIAPEKQQINCQQAFATLEEANKALKGCEDLIFHTADMAFLLDIVNGFTVGKATETEITYAYRVFHWERCTLRESGFEVIHD